MLMTVWILVDFYQRGIRIFRCRNTSNRRGGDQEPSTKYTQGSQAGVHPGYRLLVSLQADVD